MRARGLLSRLRACRPHAALRTLRPPPPAAMPAPASASMDPGPIDAPAARAPAYALRGVSKRHPGGLLALDGIDLDLPAGGFTCLLGASGCGKSTLLRILAGLDHPTAGTAVRVGHGQAPAAAPPASAPARAARPAALGGSGGSGALGALGALDALDAAPPRTGLAAPGDIGVVFQEPTLMPWASVLDNVALPLRLQRRPRAERQAAARRQIAAVGLAGFEAALPHTLSGGMKMRAALARALVTQPATLLLDEPFAALDEISRQQLDAELLALWAARRFTAVFVTHSVWEAVFLAERIVVMSPRPGRVAAVLDVQPGVPRDEAWRASADYAARCAAVSAALRQSAGGA